jgi:hypothetical protein
VAGFKVDSNDHFEFLNTLKVPYLAEPILGFLEGFSYKELSLWIQPA